tara:strand:- start:3485 stop:3649 length:165 start_codon:yes stop_codon:yes gene_type:complete
MPTASDGKKFPYTPEGIKAHKKYQAMLDRKNETMGKDRTYNPNDPLNIYNAPNT